jgi:hypothetical protein
MLRPDVLRFPRSAGCGLPQLHYTPLETVLKGWRLRQMALCNNLCKKNRLSAETEELLEANRGKGVCIFLAMDTVHVCKGYQMARFLTVQSSCATGKT